MHLLRGARPYAPEALYAQSVHKLLRPERMYHRQSVRFVHVAGYLGQELVVRHPCRGRQPKPLAYLLLYLPRYVHGQFYAGFVLRHVQEGLVQRDGFDEVCVFVEDVVHSARHLLVHMVSAGHHRQSRTPPLGRSHSQGRVYAEAPRLVAGRSHHAARTVVAHSNGPSAQLRIVALLHTGKEGIHVDVYNLPFP